MPEPDGPQFQNLWDSAMAGAQANLDAISDEELDEAVAESMISDSISDMISASQIEETGHTQESEELRRQQEAYNRVMAGRPQLTPEERAFASRHQATYDAAEAMENVDPLYPGDDMNFRGPDHSQEDPFDFMNPEEARQAKAIEDMNKTLGE